MIEMWLGLAAVVLLILANGWFVAAEFAFVAARRTRLVEQAAEGDAAAHRALRVRERLSFMLSGAQLGITATSLVVGFLAAPTFEALFEPLLSLAGLSRTAAVTAAVTVGFILSTGAQMIFGELAPKNLAIAQAEPVARRMAALQLVYLKLAGWVITLFDSSANALLRLFGITPVEELEGSVTGEELGHILTASQTEGTLQAQLVRLLRRALDFQSLRAGDALLPRPQVQWIAETASCAELQALAAETGLSRFPVCGPGGLDELEGIVQVKELLRVPPAERPQTPVRTIAEPELAVPESAGLGDVLATLRQAHAQLAVVIDEFGDVAGILTLEDVVEELVGDIEDEYDVSGPEVQRLGDGSYLVPGAWRIDEVARDTGIDLPPGEYDTVSGLVMHALGRVPEPGDQAGVDGAELHVLTMDGHAVERVRLIPVPRDEERVP